MATTKSKETEKSQSADQSALQELFLDELKDIYWAEQHLTKALTKMAKNCTSDDLRNALENHMQETENQITRLERVFESIGKKASAKKCEAMEGLIKEGEEIMKDTDKGTLTRDAGIISAAQKAEHYEIASYGTLRTLANTLGYNEAAELLDSTLSEEKKADELLTQLAEGSINQMAKNEEA